MPLFCIKCKDSKYFFSPCTEEFHHVKDYHKANNDPFVMGAAVSESSLSLPGHFLKLDGSNGSVSGLHSPVLKGSSKDCFFRMWYQVLGDVPDIVRIYKSVSFIFTEYCLSSRITPAIPFALI